MNQSKKLKKENQKIIQNNFLFVILSLLIISIVASSVTAYICNYVINSFNNTNAMAMIITDSGIKSDDITLEQNLSIATKTLIFMHELSMATVIGCIGISLSLVARIFLFSKSVDKTK